MTDKEEKIREEYLKDLYDDYRYSINKFDTYTVYLSGGALAISLTFVENIVPIKEAVWIGLYYWAIILFGFSMLLGLYAHYKSSIEIGKRLKQIIEKGYYNEQEKDKISIMNKIIIYTITIGTILLIAFSIINMNRLNKKSNQTQQNSILYQHPEITDSIKEIE